MPDQINAAFDIPYVFEITIDDLETIWRQVQGQRFALTAQSPGMLSQRRSELEVSFGTSELMLETGYVGIPVHGIEKTAVEAVVAAIIMRRVGAAVRELVSEAAEMVAFAGGDGRGGGRLQYGENGQVAGVNADYLANLLDLSNDHTGDGCIFEVLDVSLNSPLRIRSRIASMMLSLNLAIAPAGAAAIDYNLILNAINTFIAAANLGYTVSVNRPRETDNLSRAIEQEFLRLDSYCQNENVRLVQIYLKKLGYYQGEIDNVFGPLSIQAAENFATAYRIYDYVHFSDGEFLRTLAKAYIHHQILISAPPP